MANQAVQALCQRLVEGDLQAMGVEMCSATRQWLLGYTPRPEHWNIQDVSLLTKLLKELSTKDRSMRPYYLVALPINAIVVRKGEPSCEGLLNNLVEALDSIDQPLDYDDVVVMTLCIARCELLCTMGKYDECLSVARSLKPQIFQKAKGENLVMFVKSMIRWLKVVSSESPPEEKEGEGGGADPSGEDPLLLEAEQFALEGLRLMERDARLKPWVGFGTVARKHYDRIDME